MAGSGSNGASKEFVEIYNPGACTASFASVKLEYRSAAGNAGTAGFSGALEIAPGSYAVLGTEEYEGAKDAVLVSGLAAGAGQLALVRKSNGSKIDGVGWGNVTGGTYKEGSTCPAPGADLSIARIPNGSDTNNNSVDFKVGTPSPGAPNPSP